MTCKECVLSLKGVLALDGSGDFSIDAKLDGKISLSTVTNPFGLALERGEDLKGTLHSDPASPKLDALIAETSGSIERARAEGFDGVLYLLHGADLRHCTPMEYGGFFLETDRELIAQWADGVIVVVIVAGEGAYLDFVSDLPATVFAWDSNVTGVDDAAMRALRSGPLASADTRSEITFTSSRALVDLLEKQTCGSL